MKKIYPFVLTLLFTSIVNVQANSDLQSKIENPDQWALQTGDYKNQRFSKLDQINSRNVDQLHVAWSFSTGVLRGHEGSPIVVGDTMYVHSPFPNTVFALDLNNEGKVIWKYEPKQDPDVTTVMCCDTVNRGVAYANEKILLHQADTTMVALDAKSGEVVWSVVNGDPSVGETNSATVLPVKDKVIVGNSSSEFGVRGHITAYKLDTGEQIWRGYSTGPDHEMLIDPEKSTHLGKAVGANSGLNSWEDEQWSIGGGTTWGWFSYDAEEDLIFYGTDNPSAWNPSQRPGDNKWTSSIFARDLETGVVRWVYQVTPHDEWDYDGINEMILTEQEINGQIRKLLTHFNQNGFAYTLDRVTGELLVAEKFDPTVNWASHIEMDPDSSEFGRPIVHPRYSTDINGEDVKTAGICPSVLGAKNQQPASYSPELQLFFVPTNHVCMNYEPYKVSYSAGQAYIGANISMFPAPESHSGMGNFIAWDNINGKIVWSIPENFSIWSGALATVGDIVFYGTLEGYLKAVNAKTGEELYSFKTPSGIVGNIMTYGHNGKQYVAVYSGIGGWVGLGIAAGLTNPADGLGVVGGFSELNNYTTLGGQLTVFTLPNKLVTAN